MEQEKQSTILKINELNGSIRKLKYFITTVDPDHNVRRGSGSYDIDAVLKVKTDKSFSILGSRWIGFGSHEAEINVPNDLIEELQQLAKNRLNALQQELDSLLSP